MKFAIVPRAARDPKSIKVFSMREIYEDLKLNAKYKNRNNAAIQRSLEKI
jgi:hypothetical protein